MRANALRSRPDVVGTTRLAHEVQSLSLPLHTPEDLDPLMERIGNARCVLLGEASHGTSDYYLWRTWISRRLIEEKGFSFIGVEGDWPDCYRVNRYVKGALDSGRSARSVLHAFERWPTWMWANEEIVELAEWLRSHNESVRQEKRVGFFGLDVYSLWDSLHAILGYADRLGPDAARAAREAFRCFQPYGDEVQEYAWATRLVDASCEDEVIALLTSLRRQAPDYFEDDREAYFNAEQNALVIRNAEHYYRTMVQGGAASWNVRDRHMVETLQRLLAFHGPDAKAIVWEHNTHIGDARATDMARSGMVNVGQLTRQARGSNDVVLIGFGSFSGSVIAGREWGAPMERMPVPPAREGSWEDLLHESGGDNAMLLLTDGMSLDDEFYRTRGHRAIGVVYDPAYEAFGNYVPTILPQRYDAFLHIDSTEALHPLHMAAREDGEVPETYPTGV